jgi:dihydrofolate synthase/folylpolyglutamate synthase
VVDFVQQNQKSFEEIQPSFFEMTVAMAFDYFAQQKVDIALIETGLGGRLDSTNIIQPLLSLITNIGWDHEAMLGNTLAKIAAEKAGIIKANKPVLIGQRQAATSKVFEQKAQTEQAPLYFAEDIIQLELVHKTLEKAQYRIDSSDPVLGQIAVLETDLVGSYQQHNLGAALACCSLLNGEGFVLDGQTIEAACQKVLPLSKLMGRWQILGKKPLIIGESGHNKDGIAFLTKELKEQVFDQLHFVIGTVNDKDLSIILQQLPTTASYYFCKADIPRGLAANLLQKEALKYNLKGTSFPSVAAAFEAAKKMAKPADCILVAGSIFVVAEVLP